MTLWTTNVEKQPQFGPDSDSSLVKIEGKSRADFIARFVLMMTMGWVALIWTYRFLPFQDYPAWIYAGQVFSDSIRGQALPFYSIVHWPVPNTVFVAFLGFSDLFFRPEISGKIFLTLCVLLYVFGSYRLVGSLTTRRDSPLFLLPLLYVFQRTTVVGELAFSCGLAVLLIAMAYVLSASRPSLWAILGFSLLIFASHAICFFFWLICLAVLMTVEPSTFRTPKTLLAVSPSLLLMAWYAFKRVHAASGNTTPSLMTVVRKKLTIVSAFSPLHFFDPFYSTDPRPLHAIAICFNFCALSTVLVIAVLWVRQIRHAEWTLPDSRGRAAAATIGIFFAAFLLAPFASLTGVPDANYRFLLPMYILMLGSLEGSKLHAWGSERTRWALTFAAATAVSCVLLFYFVYLGGIDHKLREINAAVSQADLNPDFRELANTEMQDLARTNIQPVPLLPNSSSAITRLLPVHAALDYFTYYLRAERRIPSLVFPTSIIRSSFVYPPLVDASRRMTALPSAVVILGDQVANRSNARLIMGSYRIVADREYVMILRRQEKQTPATNTDSSLHRGKDD